MRPLTFSPGPSKISDETYRDIIEASESGVLECSHRSDAFYTLSSSCLTSLRAYLGIPDDYHIHFLDSASTAWHSIIANTVRKKSAHVVAGAFAKKAADASTLLYKEAMVASFPLGTAPDMGNIDFPLDTECITTCYNESSTGVMLTQNDLQALRSAYPDALLAVDVTSCTGAVSLTITDADIWYFSVQKAFGLPPGLGVIIFSPRAYERSLALEETYENLAGMWRWSTFVRTHEAKHGETPQTPNILNIFLLKQQCERFIALGGINAVEQQTREKATRILDMVDAHSMLSHFVTDAMHRSPTIVTIKADPDYVDALMRAASLENITLGAGYGSLKETTFRVANFPAITNNDLDRLIKVVEKTGI